MMKSMKKSSRKKWSELKKMVAKKSVGKESVLKFTESSTKRPPSSPRSSKRALKHKSKFGNSCNNPSSSRTWTSKTCHASSRQQKSTMFNKIKQSFRKASKETLCMLFHRASMIATKSSMDKILTLRHIRQARLSANFLWCIMLQELLLLPAKPMAHSSSLIDRLSGISFKRLRSIKEVITARFCPKLTFYRTWIPMKEIKFAMLWDNKISEPMSTLWSKDKLEINSTLLLRANASPRKKKAVPQFKKFSSTNLANILAKLP